MSNFRVFVHVYLLLLFIQSVFMHRFLLCMLIYLWIVWLWQNRNDAFVYATLCVHLPGGMHNVRRLIYYTMAYTVLWNPFKFIENIINGLIRLKMHNLTGCKRWARRSRVFDWTFSLVWNIEISLYVLRLFYIYIYALRYRRVQGRQLFFQDNVYNNARSACIVAYVCIWVNVLKYRTNELCQDPYDLCYI